MISDQHFASPAYLKAARVWRPHLTVTEFAIVTFILDHTTERGVPELCARFDDLASGVPAKEGPWPWDITPIGVSRANFYRAISRLKAMGLVLATGVHQVHTRFSVNTDWQPDAAAKH